MEANNVTTKKYHAKLQNMIKYLKKKPPDKQKSKQKKTQPNTEMLHKNVKLSWRGNPPTNKVSSTV